jgi:integrase
MAAVQERNGRFRILFRYAGKQHAFTIVEDIDRKTADGRASKAEELLRLLKSGRITLPPAIDIATFVEHDGKPPETPSGVVVTRQSTSLGQLRDNYLETFSNGTIEETTLCTRRIHFGHLVRILGAGVKLLDITHAQLQGYVKKRGAKTKKNGVGEETIRREISTLRAAWNWGARSNLVTGVLPNKGLRYPRSTEKPPFMTRDEIERRIAAGEPASDLWECLYLRTPEIIELIETVAANATHPFILPMFAIAAYTGARKSEILRSQRTDIDMEAGAIVLREKKREQGRDSTRRVPLSPALAKILAEWLAVAPESSFTIAKPALARSRTKKPAGERLTPREAHDHLQRTLADTKWKCVRGYHVLRHSFISALANRGIDQRIIDEFVGHQSEQQRKRYRHLYPTTLKDAITTTFG